jgi:cytochrome b
MKSVKVWDIQTRVFHWSLAAFAAAALVTADVPAWVGIKTLRSDVWLRFHVAVGTAVGVLLAFRILWVFKGNYYGRFYSFRLRLADLRRYLKSVYRNEHEPCLGHNPAASWTVVGAISLGLLAVATGVMLFAIEENRGLFRGIYVRYYMYGQSMKYVHLAASLLFLLNILTHVSGVLFKTMRHRTGIIGAMFTGVKKSHEEGIVVEISRPLRAAALAWVLIPLPLAALMFLYKPDTNPGARLKTMPTAMPAVVKKECGSCHMAYTPNILPAASWKKLMAGLEDHFGEDASVDEPSRRRIEDFMTANSAERSIEEISLKILRQTGSAGAPLRITETTYWRVKHADIGPTIYARASIKNRINCAACHLRAEAGSYEDDDIIIPK